MDPEKVQAAFEALKTGDAEAALALLEDMLVSAAGGDSSTETPDDPSALESAPEEEPEEDKLAKLGAVVGRTEFGEVLAEVKRLRTLVDTSEKERAAYEANERKVLVADLVKLGFELPATAWTDDAKTKLSPRLVNEPITELRARVEVLKKARPQKELKAPTTEAVELSAAEQAAADKIQDPAAKARFISLRAMRRKGA